MKFVPTYGAEIEKPISNLSSNLPHKTSQDFFKRLFQYAEKRNAKPVYHKSDIDKEVITGVVSSDLGEQGIDNGFNLLETASTVHTSLASLSRALTKDLRTTIKSLKKENATVLNSSIHPLGKTDFTSYQHFVAPKGVYSYIWHRGWNHAAGIDGKAQNSPATGIEIKNAAKAVSTIIGIGAATIGLTANSPFVNGKKTKFKEARLTIWNEMFKNSKVQNDLIVSQFPSRPFENLAEYFNWMFGDNSAIHFVIRVGSEGYKGVGDSILIPEKNISVLDFLSSDKIPTYKITDAGSKQRKVQMVKPNISDLEMMQWAQFAGARIRFKLKNHESFPLKEFVRACKEKNNSVETLMERFTEFVYIEGRDPGANFPDATILKAGKKVADSVIIAPSALQAGILQNLERTYAYLDEIGWNTLGGLRASAIQDGLGGKFEGVKVFDFTYQILQLATEGLEKKDRKYLSYFNWVLESKENSADRAVKFYNSLEKKDIRKLVQHLKVEI